MELNKLIHELPKGLIKWYNFRPAAEVIFFTAGTESDTALVEALRESGLTVRDISYTDAVCMDMTYIDTACAEEICNAAAFEKCGQKRHEDMYGKYDYAMITSAIELISGKKAAEEFLKTAYSVLKPDGVLLLAADNRLGVRYFCGDQDPYTGRNFDGIENYRRVSLQDADRFNGRLYAKAELTDMLEAAGFSNHKFYSVFPENDDPQILCAEDYAPPEELNIRIFPQYHAPNTVFLEEEYLYTTLIQNGMFHTMANGFLAECPKKGEFSAVDYVTVSVNRGRENALCTIVRKDGKVQKKSLYEQGIEKLTRLQDNQTYLENHGVHMIDMEFSGDSLLMPYVDGAPLVSYFQKLMIEDREKFYKEFDRLWQVILNSSEHVPYEEVDWEHFNPYWDEANEKEQKKIDRKQWERVAFGTKEEQDSLGVVLKRGYIDLVLLNGFMKDGEFIFYDQELYVESLPAKAVMLRNIDFLYGNNRIERVLPREKLMERYGINKYKEIFYAHIGHFLTKLRNDDILKEYHKERRRDGEVVHSNRQRMNYSAEEYQRLFVDIFQNLDNKALYLFGSGNFTKKFLAMYGEDYPVTAILDNNVQKWGTRLEEIGIVSPEVLKNLDSSTYKVIICIKNYPDVLKQVKELGAKNIGIYETNMEYARKLKRNTAAFADNTCAGYTNAGDTNADSIQTQKKYHVGYVAGVFDLFHMGHLNLLRRAKEQCDYLIVGVVTDEGVRKNKKTDSFIPFEERLAIVQACRYVDEAVGIPLEFCDTKDAYLKFQFDAQFSGSDYVDDEAWLEKQKFLHEHGAELVFFPYTESTSSTKIKEMINKKLV